MKDNKDRDEVLAAVKKDGWALYDADDSLKKDREIVLVAVKQSGAALEFADESLKKDREIVMAAVKQTGFALDDADESLKKDREVVLAAVKQDWSILMKSSTFLDDAGKEFKKDREIIMAAIKQNEGAIQYADKEIRSDKVFMMKNITDKSLLEEFLIKKVGTRNKKKGKRRFRIDAGNSGGELVVGTVDGAFVEHFVNNESDGDLIEALLSYQSGDDIDPGIPKPGEGFSNWDENDDITHLNCCYSDSAFSWCEVPTDKSGDYDYLDAEEFEPHHLYDRETYRLSSKPNEDDIEKGDEWIPVLVFHSGEEGNNGCWFAETNGADFDPKKVAFSSVDTDVASIVEDVWYGKKRLEHDMSLAEVSDGSGYYAEVGWMNSRLQDTLESIDSDLRYFEFKDAHSSKFWELSVAGSTVTARYGKIGTNGQTSVKELDSPEQAQEHARKQAAGKLKKGYQEI